MNPASRLVRPLILAFATSCLAASALATATEHDPGAWATISTTDVFPTAGENSRWHYWFDAQARYFDVGSGINQWMVRPAIGYAINENVKAWLGYARFRSRGRSGAVADEDRFWQQVDWTAGRWNQTRISMRVRLEQRSVSLGDDTGHVVRFMTKFVRPLAGSGGTNLVVAIEPFIALDDTDWGLNSGLGQNRLFLGLGWRLSNRVSVESGYLNQYIWRDNAEDLNNHIALLSFKVKL